MGAWNEETTKFRLMKYGVPASKLKLTKLRHKNKDLTPKNYDKIWGNAKDAKIKIKQPEGDYEITFVVAWTIREYYFQSDKHPRPPNLPWVYAFEFADLKMWVKSSKMPANHVMDIHARLNRIKNAKDRSSMEPNAMIDVDIWTGHAVMGKWTTHLKCCDVHGVKGIIRNFK